MKINGIAHLAYMTNDMEKSLHFYCDILKFKKKFVINDDNGNPWIVYLEIADRQFLELFYKNEETICQYREFWDMMKRTGYMHLSLEAEGLREIESYLKECGIDIIVSTNLGQDNTWQLWIADPDGNAIEFHEYTDKSYQLYGRKDS